MKRILIILLLLFAVRSQAQFNNPFDWFGVRRIPVVHPDLTETSVYWLSSNSSTMYGITSYGDLYTTPNGYDWTLQNIDNYKTIICNHVKNDSIYLGTTSNGIYFSTNNGSSYSNIPFPYSISLIDVLGSEIYVVSANGEGIYYSSNNGADWIYRGVDTIIDEHYLWISHYNTTLTVGTDNGEIGGFNGGIFISTNKGVNWTRTLVDSLCGGTNWIVSNNTDLYSASDWTGNENFEGVFKSTDGGLNWTQTLDSMEGNVVISKDSVVYAGSWTNGLFATTNDGTSWEYLGYDTSLIYSGTAFGNDSIYFGGTHGVFTTPKLHHASAPSYKAYVQRSLDFIGHADSTGVILDTLQRHFYNDSLFTMLIDSGLIGTTRAGDSLVSLYCYGLVYGKDTAITRVNLLNPWQYKSFKIGTVTDTDTGVISNGNGSSYIKLVFNNRSDSTIAKKYSGGCLIYSMTDVTDDSYTDFGSSSAGGSSSINLMYSDNSCTPSWNGSNGVTLSNILSSRAVFGISRTSSTKFNVLINGVSQGEQTETGVAIANSVLNFGYAPRCIMFVAITSGLSVTKMRALQNILNYSLTGRHHNVY